MIEAGLETDIEDGLKDLKQIVDEYGSNYENHFDVLLEKHGCGGNPRILAAGILAYHNTKSAYLVPFPDTVPTLLTLRQRGYRIGVITEGRSVKQWEKLISLGLQHFFHVVLVSEDVKMQKPDAELFREAARRIGCMPKEAVMVGDRLDKDIAGGKECRNAYHTGIAGKILGPKAFSAFRGAGLHSPKSKRDIVDTEIMHSSRG